MEQTPGIRIVEFGGRELSVEEAEAGRYIFASGPQVQPLVAFPLESYSEQDVERQVERWAESEGVLPELRRAREAVASLPEDPDAVVDKEAERAEVERINAGLEDLQRETGLAMGSEELFELAHERGVFDSAILFSKPLYATPSSLGLKSSCTDLRRYGFATGARSARAFGYQAVQLYEQANYGPYRSLPAVTLVPGTARASVDFTLKPILSALFVG